ncbi:hypothetical protein EJ419_03800 [Alloscardovia theropitheci]|uniref:Uncharacterized protein n=1 Tax=Alloscardovia theropitheci TaxID=2496842 RepID=A0A4R0QZR8_9BIFI|nr:hypothetical protein [Alloscardovia theropitheci]TCD54176.1 hypothetical protein EJ419_03800 [Alloscardovia theropitheci]
MTDDNSIPSLGNFNPNSHSASHEDSEDVLNEKRWDIPNLNGFDFELTDEQTIANTQSLTQLSESTSTALRAINAREQEEAARALQARREYNDNRDSQDPEATSSFDPLADDADMLPSHEDSHSNTDNASATNDDSAQTIIISGKPVLNPQTNTQDANAQVEAQSAESTRTIDTSDETSVVLPDTAVTHSEDGEETLVSGFEGLDDFTETDDSDNSADTQSHDYLGDQPIAPSASRAGHGTHAHKVSDEEASARNTRRMLIWGIAGVLVIALVVGLTIFFRNMANAQTHEQLLATCTSSRESAQTSSANLQKLVNDTNSVASTQSVDVEDTSTLTRIKNAINQANASINSEKDLDACTASLSDIQLRNIAQQADTIVNNQTEYTTAINKAKTAVENSKATKTQSNAKNDLTSKRQEAQTLYDQSNGKVTDETTRTNLKKAIDAADQLIAQNIKNVTSSQYSSAIDTLNNTMTAVQNSMKAYDDAQKEKDANIAGVCAPFAGTYSNGSTRVTLRGDCSVRYSDDSVGNPSTCTFPDGSTGSCATVDNAENPNEINWSMECLQNGSCSNADVSVSGKNGQTTLNIGGQTYRKQ